MASPVGLAVDEASRSSHKAKHGAVVYKNGKIIQSGRNQYCSLNRLRNYKSNRIWSIHAEMNALANLPKNITRGAGIIVVKVNREGDLTNSRPCRVCMSIIERMGIKRVMYSTDTNKMFKENVVKYKK